MQQKFSHRWKYVHGGALCRLTSSVTCMHVQWIVIWFTIRNHWKGTPWKLWQQDEMPSAEACGIAGDEAQFKERPSVKKSFTRWRNPFVTTEPAVPVTISGLLAHRLQSVSSAETNFGGHKLKRHCDVETATRTDIKADASVLTVSMWQSTGTEYD